MLSKAIVKATCDHCGDVAELEFGAGIYRELRLLGWKRVDHLHRDNDLVFCPKPGCQAKALEGER